jgi:hypothetical protein
LKAPQTSSFIASNPARFSFRNLLFILMRSFLKDQQTLSSQMWLTLGMVRGARSLWATCYLGLPMVALDYFPRVGTVDCFHATSSKIGSQWRQLLLGIDSQACLITKFWRWWLCPLTVTIHSSVSTMHKAHTIFYLTSVSCWQVGTVKHHWGQMPQKGPYRAFG